MKPRSIFSGIGVLALALGISVIGSTQVSAKDRIEIGTAHPGGYYYTISAAISECLQKWGDLQVRVQAAGGGVQCVRLFDSGDINMSTLAGQQIVTGTKGIKPFEKKYDMRIGFFFGHSPYEMVVLDESPIRSFYDLKGKKIAVGAMGSGIEQKTKVIMESFGMSYNDFKPMFIGQTDGTDGLTDGVVDATVLMGLPSSALTSLALVKKVRILPIPEDVIQKISKENPYLVPSVIPGNSYKNQPDPIKVVSETDFMVFGPKVSEEVAYRVMKTCFEHLDYLGPAHPLLKVLTAEKACSVDIGVPYHTGAIRYFKEAGVWKR